MSERVEAVARAICAVEGDCMGNRCPGGCRAWVQAQAALAVDALVCLSADVERLTRERDEARQDYRDACEPRGYLDLMRKWQAAEARVAELEGLVRSIKSLTQYAYASARGEASKRIEVIIAALNRSKTDA